MSEPAGMTGFIRKTDIVHVQRIDVVIRRNLAENLDEYARTSGRHGFRLT